MKKVFPLIICVLLLGISCSNQRTELTDEQKATIASEVENQYRNVVSDLCTFDIEKWSQPYSKDNFISVNSLVNYFPSFNSWRDYVANAFSLRESQEVKIVEINTTVLSSDLVLLTSIANWNILFKSGEQIKDSKTIASLLWKKEQSGWKIIYIHESWQENNEE
jgi:hypothetical protein